MSKFEHWLEARKLDVYHSWIGKVGRYGWRNCLSMILYQWAKDLAGGEDKLLLNKIFIGEL